MHRKVWRESELFFLVDEPDPSRSRLSLASTEMQPDLIDPADFVVLLPGEGFSREEESRLPASLLPGEHRVTLVMRNQEYSGGRMGTRCLVAPPVAITIKP